MTNEVPYVPPLRRAADSPQKTKTAKLVDGQLRCPDHRGRSLQRGSGTVMRCPICRAKIVEAVGDAL